MKTPSKAAAILRLGMCTEVWRFVQMVLQHKVQLIFLSQSHVFCAGLVSGKLTLCRKNCGQSRNSACSSGAFAAALSNFSLSSGAMQDHTLGAP